MPLSRAFLLSLTAAVALHVVVVVRVASRPLVVAVAGTEAVPFDMQLNALPTSELHEVDLGPASPPPATPDDTATPAALAPRLAAVGRPIVRDPSTPPDASPPAVTPLVGAGEGNEGVLSPRATGPASSPAAVAPPVRFGLPLGSFAEGAPAPKQEGPVGPRVERSAQEAPVDAAKILRAATDKHDVALGVGFGGPVAAAGRSALSSPSAPIGGRGRYEVRTNATGQIVSVRALEGDAAWQAFATTLQAVLASRTLRVPEGARGVVVVIALEAKQKEIAGGPSGIMNFDVANLAAGPSRVVSARVESERTL